MPKPPFRIGMIGYGNIGTGLVRHFCDYESMLNSRVEGGLEFVAIAMRDAKAPRAVPPPEGTHLTDNWRELIDEGSIDALIELVGVGSDGKPTLALEIARACLGSGKHLITANKALIAEHGAELQELADKNGVLLLFEASVGAGIPIIASLQGGLAASRITSIHGILNGTCNYILTRLEDEHGLSLTEAVAEAQELGYAEPDPRFDIEGDDTAYKIAILASLAFGQELHLSDVEKDGITQLSEAEFAFARENALSLKLLASATLHRGELAEIRVRPVFIPVRHVLAGVRGVNNAVLINGTPIGETLYYGAGAGQASTSSGLLADVITAARHWNPDAGNPHPLRIQRGVRNVYDRRGREEQVYLRINLPEKEGVREDVGAIVPGEVVGHDDKHFSFVTPRMTETTLHNLLGKLNDLGVPRTEICDVRFAFMTTREAKPS